MESGKCEGGCCGEGMRGCKCMHHKAGGIVVAALGLIIMSWGLGYLDAETTVTVMGTLVALVGFKKMFAGMCKCC